MLCDLIEQAGCYFNLCEKFNASLTSQNKKIDSIYKFIKNEIDWQHETMRINCRQQRALVLS